MFDQDTICAVSTAPGEGGIGIIRLSGKDAVRFAARLFRPQDNQNIASTATHTIHYGKITDPSTSEVIDEVLVSIMRAPRSYTREDVVEINCHGGMMPLWRVMSLLIAAGARQAEPGEFTKRAFLSGRIDLAQAEAVLDIIRSKTELSHKAAHQQLLGGLSQEIVALRDRLITLLASVEAGIDFSEEEIETGTNATIREDAQSILSGIDRLLDGFQYGRILRDGIATAIVGRPNVGKSSLLNALLRQDRAIVTDIPGTTRDVLEDFLSISGIPFKILDTAGIRHTQDRIEQEGVRRSLAAIETADIVVVVLDGSEPLNDEDKRVLSELTNKKIIAVINKSDLKRKMEKIDWPQMQISISCKAGTGLDQLRTVISDMVKNGMVSPKDHSWAVNQRHKTALEQAKESLLKAIASIDAGASPEFVAMDLRGTLDSIGLIVGATYTDDILERIFREFCIGK